MISLFLVIATLVFAFIVANIVWSEAYDEARICVPQSPDQVWSVLTDYPPYPRWNTGMTKVTGDLVLGKVLTVTVPGMTFKPTVLAVEPGRELRWVGVIVMGGKQLGAFYRGEHRWLLFRNTSSGTDIVQREDFSGMFLWLFNPGKYKGSFAVTNRDLAAELARRYPVPVASTPASAPAAAVD